MIVSVLCWLDLMFHVIYNYVLFRLRHLLCVGESKISLFFRFCSVVMNIDNPFDSMRGANAAKGMASIPLRKMQIVVAARQWRSSNLGTRTPLDEPAVFAGTHT